jgi:hypothetical protein
MELLQNLLETLVEGYRAIIDLLSPLIASLAGVLGIFLSPEQSRILTTLLVILFGAWAVGKAASRLWSKPKPAVLAQRTNDIAESLARISVEADTLLEEMALVIRDKDIAIKQREHELAELEVREEELKTRIETLNKVSIPAAQHFISLLEKGERRSARRDYILFALGAIIGTIPSLLALR